jgi:DNA-binding HxlR family transcriptional regulator
MAAKRRGSGAAPLPEIRTSEDVEKTVVEPATGNSAWANGAAQPGGETFCGVAAAVALLGDAWTLLILRDLEAGPRRFGALHASTGISVRVLTDRLRAMNAAGLITRRGYAEIPPRVEYELTEKGRGALPVVVALRVFGETWLRPSQAADRQGA